MAASLLATKLFIPPARPGLVSRPRLMEQMRSALGYGLVLVSAPAGSGKTTLVSDWVRHVQASISAVWISLDAADSDPIRFWDYFIGALRRIYPTVGETSLTLMHSSERLSDESILTPLINDLSSQSGDLVVVLDDYHLIQSGEVHSGMTFLIEHLPPKLHLVIATRTEPPLPLSAFRGRGTLLEARADDLRFTNDEAALLLRALQNHHLSAEEVDALNTRTEGWVAGLTMAALSLEKERHAQGFISRFTGSERHVTKPSVSPCSHSSLILPPAISLITTILIENFFPPGE